MGSGLRGLLWAMALHLAAPAQGWAQVPFFRWIDNKGDLHISDVLGDVPEPYYSMYKAKLREQKEKSSSRPAPAPAKPAPRPAQRNQVRPKPSAAKGPSVIDVQIRKREQWKRMIATWRQNLAAATAKLERIDKGIAQLRMNPVLRETPQVKAKVRASEQARRAALAKVQAATQMLLKTLPEKARRDRVPPKWLE